eukprot:3603660-Rhodomonas_salina.4
MEQTCPYKALDTRGSFVDRRWSWKSVSVKCAHSASVSVSPVSFSAALLDSAVRNLRRSANRDVGIRVWTSMLVHIRFVRSEERMEAEEEERREDDGEIERASEREREAPVGHVLFGLHVLRSEVVEGTLQP